MSATFVLKRSNGSEDSIEVVYNETPETFAGKVGSFEDVISIDIEFDNTGCHIPVFIYTEEELTALEELTEESTPVRSSFITTQKYFSPLLKSELDKFINIEDLNIIASGVIEDDSFPSSFPINIVASKMLPRANPPLNLSTPNDLYNLMISTNTTVLDGDYVLMNDIDMTGYTSQSIGNFNTSLYFTGSFDGQGHTIKIGQTVSSNFGGLFNFVYNSTFIKDLTVEYLADGSGNTLATFTGCSFTAVSLFANGGLVAYIYRDSSLGTPTNISNCNIIYNGNVSMSGNSNSGFISAVNPIGGALTINLTSCNVIFNGNATMNFTTAGRGGSFSALLNACTVVGCSSTITGNLSMVNNGQAGGFCASILLASVSGCSLISKNITLTNNASFNNPSAGFTALIRNSTFFNNSMKIVALTITNAIFGSAGVAQVANLNTSGSTCSDFSALIEGDVNITCKNIGDAGGVIGRIDATSATLTRFFGVFTGNVSLSALKIGGLIGNVQPSSGTSSISNSNTTFNKTVSFTGIGLGNDAGGVCGAAASGGSVNNCSAFYGENAVFTATYIGGVGSTCAIGSSFTKAVATYNSYTFTGTTVDNTFAVVGGTATNCYSTTFSTDTSIIPDDTDNVIFQLNSVTDTEWLSSLLNIRQSLDTGNNSQYLSDIFTVDSPGVSNTAKNNALTAGMTFATVPYIITTSSVIEPLLVKYQSPLPSTIRYTAQNSVDEIDITDLAAYYIYQNPAYIIPANKTIESSTAGDGSVAFDTTSVAVGSNITINDAVYNVRGVGSSLLEVTAPEPEPVPTETSNNLPIFFAVIAGVILLLVLVFSYIWGWKGWMVLPAIIGLTLAILAIVFAL